MDLKLPGLMGVDFGALYDCYMRDVWLGLRFCWDRRYLCYSLGCVMGKYRWLGVLYFLIPIHIHLTLVTTKSSSYGHHVHLCFLVPGLEWCGVLEAPHIF
jgi:hypothetical protein